MKTVNVETLLAKIIPFVSGCNDTIAKIVLADAARTFARETDIITETQGYDIADAPEYGRIPEFAVDKENFLPLHFVARNEDKPNRKVYVTYSLLPTANLMPEAVINRFHEAITSQALFMLYSMPGKPWTAPDMAQLYLQKYRIAAGDAMRDNNTGGAVFDQYMICGEPGDGGFIGAQNITATVIGTDTSDGNITPNTVLFGYAGYAKGEKVVGNIKSVTASLNKNIFTVPMGYVGSPVTLSIPEVTATLNKNTATVPVGYIGKEQKLTVPVANITNDGEYVTVPVGYVESEQKFKVGGNTGVNVDFVTATASDILSGKTGTDKSGNPVNGTIATVTASKSGNVVTVPKGYIATVQTLTIDAAQSATVSGNVVTIYPGYTAAQYTAIIPKAASSVSGNVVTIPAGYHDATTKTVAEMAEPSVSANVVTIPVGYNKVQKTKTIPEAEIRYGTSEGGNVTKHSLRISAGYVPEEKSWTFHETDLGGINATADKMLSGTVSLDAQGDKITGNIPTVTASLENDVVTVPKGYIAEQQTFEVGSSGGSTDFYKCAAVYGPHNVDCYVVTGCPDEAVNGTYMPTENTTEDWEGNQQTVYSNGTYYYYYEPNDYMGWGISTDYTGYLTYRGGVGSSWSDSDWNEVTGMSCAESKVEVDTDVPKTWDGYKAVQSGGVYSFESDVTTGLTYGTAYKPIVDKLYSPDASLCFQGIKMAIPDDPLIYLSLSGQANTAETGQALTYPKDLKKFYVFGEIIDGVPCITFLSNGGIIVTQPLPLDGDFTISSWCRANTYSGVASIWKIGTETKNEMRLGTRDNGNLVIETYSSDGQRSEISNVGKQFSWFHIVVKKQSNIVSAYLDGYFVGTVEWNITLIDDGTCHVGYPHGSSGLGASNRSQAAFRFYARALSDDEIFALANEFVPKK